MAGGEARAWQHEAGVSRRDCHRDSGSHLGALARRERQRLDGVEVEGGVVVVGPGRRQGVLGDPLVAQPQAGGPPLSESCAAGRAGCFA